MPDGGTAAHARPAGAGLSVPVLLGLLLVLALLLSGWNLTGVLPLERWAAVLDPATTDIQAIIVQQAMLPRLVTAWLAGAALGLSGVLFQQILRNPLADPSTLGVSAGAQLALTACTLFLPAATLGLGREAVCFVGALVALALVLSLAWRRTMAATTLVLAGLIVTFYAGSIAALLVIFNRDFLESVFIWGSGSLVQNGWHTAGYLAPRLLVGALLALLVRRPLGLLDLGDDAAQGLGLSLKQARLLGLGLATALAAATVSAVGIIGFVGLAAPALARRAGARRFATRLLVAPLIGCGLLWLTDQLVQLVFGSDRELVPTGAMTALLGAPLLLYLLRRLKPGLGELVSPAMPTGSGRMRSTTLIRAALLLLCLAVVVALFLGQNAHGWHWAGLEEWQRLLPWRWPRVLAAAGAGFMLGIAGVLLQRLTGNPMASPEILGLSSGVAIGVIALLLAVPGLPPRGVQFAAGTVGALLALGLLLILGRRSSFAPDHMLLGGVAIGTAMSALGAVVLASGDPRKATLLSWMAGSTWSADPATALIATALALAALALSPLARRWLELLPLGAPTGRALGVPVAAARLSIVVGAAILTAAATLIVGPLSFAGLMAPHMARLMGARRAWSHGLSAGLIGALLMVAADWLGRTLLFPYEIPAGLMATFIGTPYLLWLLQRH